MPALTLFLTSTNDTGSLSTARTLVSSAPASETSVTATGTLAKNATGYAEMLAQGGSTGTGAFGSSEPTVSGHGFIFDTTTLEGSALRAGLAQDSSGAMNAVAAAYDSSANLTYRMGGSGPSGFMATTTAYSTASDCWTMEANDSAGSRSSAAAAYDSSANLTYVVDGNVNSSGESQNVNAYSHTSNAWTAQASDTATARARLAAAYDSSANLTYAIDGFTGTETSAVTAFSHGSNSWTTEASDTARCFLAAAYDSSANLTYAIDGTINGSGSGDSSTNNAYSHSSNAWTSEATDTAREQLAAVYDSSANLTYAIDGQTGVIASYLSTTTGYSHASNAWTTEGFDAVTRMGLGAAYDSNANLTYAFDGYNSSTGYLTTLTAYSASSGWSTLTNNYSGTIKVAEVSGNGVTMYLWMRLFKWSSAGGYQQFLSGGVATHLGITSSTSLNTTAQTFTGSQTFDDVTFAAGEKLYVDVIIEVTTGDSSHAGSGGFRLFENGGSAERVVTPGYAPTPRTPTTPTVVSAAVARASNY